MLRRMHVRVIQRRQRRVVGWLVIALYHFGANPLTIFQRQHTVVAELAGVFAYRLGDGVHTPKRFRRVRSDLMPRRVRPTVAGLVPVDGATPFLESVYLAWLRVRLHVRAVLSELLRRYERDLEQFCCFLRIFCKVLLEYSRTQIRGRIML